MTNRPLIFLLLPALATLLTSCSGTPSCGNSHAYKTNTARSLLKAPAGVTLPAPDNAYVIPAAGTAVAAVPAAGTTSGPCLVTPPSVLTPEDMAKPVKAASAPKPVAAPASGSKAAVSPAAQPATRPPRIASSGGME